MERFIEKRNAIERLAENVVTEVTRTGLVVAALIITGAVLKAAILYLIH
jgi:hypothetical protein